MRLCHIFITVGAVATVGIASATSNLTLAEVLADIPSCALGCLIYYIPSSTCPTTNLTCVCTNTPLQANLSVCIQRSCNFTAQTKVAEVNEVICAGIPLDFRGWQVIIVGLVFGIITLITVILRCYSRYVIAQGFWWDDWSILAALVLLAATVLVATFNCMLGYGKHFWNIEPTKISALLKLFWSGEILYNATLAMTRVSILLFYLRVFQGIWFRIFTKASIAFAIISGLAFNFVILFQCNPISGAWDWTIPRSQCINLNAMAFANAGVGITQDVVILLMAIPNLLNLQMNIMKKVNLVFLFSLGGLAVITSIVRLRFIVAFGDSMDPTWDNIIPSTWSILEISIAMICTCLPSIRALLYRWFPSVCLTTSSHTTRNYTGNSSHFLNKSQDLQSNSDSWNYSSQINDSKSRSASKVIRLDNLRSSSENIISHSALEGANGCCEHETGKRSDEVVFFHVSHDAVPLTRLDKNHIAKQVVVTVNSSTTISFSRSNERITAK